MYSNDKSTYPLCPIPDDHTRLFFEVDSSARDPAGIPCVLHLSNGRTLAHAFDTHEHFKGAMVEEIKCTRTYVGHQFSDWECEATPPLPTALYMKYHVHCVEETRDGNMPTIQQYFHDRYNYAMSLYDDSMSGQMISNKLNTFITSVKGRVPWHTQHENNKGPTGLLKTTYLSDEDRNPAYIVHYSGAGGNPVNPITGIELSESELVSDNPELTEILPADFCAVTYSIKSNHYYLTLIAGSSMWIFFPICTLVAGLVITSVTSAFHRQVMVEQGIPVRPNPSPVDVCLRITRVCCASLVFCIVNTFIYFVARGVLDIYSYVDGATATATLVIQYIMWLLTSIIYLWTIPTGYDMFYPAIPHGIRRRLAFLETEYSKAQHKTREFHRRNALRKESLKEDEDEIRIEAELMVEGDIKQKDPDVENVDSSVYTEHLERRNDQDPDDHKVD